MCLRGFLRVGMVLSVLLSPNVVGSVQAGHVIDLDCAQTRGRINPFAEINAGPVPIYYGAGAASLTEQYHDIGITMVRTHDFYGPTDVSTIFPDWAADPALAASYDFTASDAVINGIVGSGIAVFFRLGESASDNATRRRPPPDFSKWAEVCRRIVMHYNAGWADGFACGITYWEVWNEPDLDGFWTGTAQEYYRLYRLTAEALKGYDPTLKVGGPCTSSVTDERYTRAFLDFVTENEVPLDFYSWHRYGDSPGDMAAASRNVRDLLDGYGLTGCENITTEWNSSILTPQRDKDNARNAAFTAGSLSVFQDAGLDKAFRYRGTSDDSRLGRLLGLDLSLFTAEGTWKRPALVYLAMQHLATAAPLRLETPPMDAATGITWLAGIAANGSCAAVLMSNFDAGDMVIDLCLRNLPWPGNAQAARYLIDDWHHFELVAQTDIARAVYTDSFVLKKNSVVLLHLTSGGNLPPEGPAVAEIPPLLQITLLDPLLNLWRFWLLRLLFG